MDFPNFQATGIHPIQSLARCLGRFAVNQGARKPFPKIICELQKSPAH